MRALINVKLPATNDGQYISVQEFLEIMSRLGVRPIDMPSDGDFEELRNYCLLRAEPIFDRMPEKSEEEKAKKEFSRKNIVFASDLPESSTLFMVTAHTEREFRFRLLNPKIEALQEGCKDLVLKIREYNNKHPTKKLELGINIDIFEHGLEESTISGTIIESRWQAARKIARRDILIAVIGLILFLSLTAILLLEVIPEGTIHTILDRLSTAMFTAMVVSSITVYYVYRELAPIIQWTTSYEQK